MEEIIVKKGRYDVAQICLKGHLINHSINLYPERNRGACPQCGSEFIIQCPHCKTPIKGQYYVSKNDKSVDSIYLYPAHQYVVPDVCEKCGRRYPWATKGVFKKIFNTLSRKHR